MDYKVINEGASKKIVNHFNQEGIAILAVIGLNVDNDKKGAFTILCPGSNPETIKQILTDLLQEYEYGDAKTWISPNIE